MRENGFKHQNDEKTVIWTFENNIVCILLRQNPPTTLSICSISPGYTDKRFSTRHGVHLQTGTTDGGIWHVANIKFTGLIKGLWWDYFVAFLKHPWCEKLKESSVNPSDTPEWIDILCSSFFCKVLLAVQNFTNIRIAGLLWRCWCWCWRWCWCWWWKRRFLTIWLFLIWHLPKISHLRAWGMNLAIG